jgi:hypothetical protein
MKGSAKEWKKGRNEKQTRKEWKTARALYQINWLTDQRDLQLWDLDPWRKHKGENNGYVVFKLYTCIMHGSGEKYRGGDGGEGRYSAPRYSTPPFPTPFLQQASGQIFKDDVNGFPSALDICFMSRPRT